MKLFVFLQSQYKVLGARPLRNKNSISNSFNWRNLLFLICVVQLGVLSTVYLLIDAKTVPECADAFYIFATAAVNALNTLAIILNMANILQLIENLEKNIQNRRLQTIYAGFD